MKRKRFAEFFAGAGLVRLGLEGAGWTCLFANDIDPKKAAVYSMNFNGARFMVEDIHHVRPEDVPDVELATASFPCTDLSLAGQRRGLAGKESGSFYGFARLLEKMGRRRPPMVLLENVPGLLTSRGGLDIEQTLATLGAMGYLVDMFTVDARWFTPQSRLRLFILGRKTTVKKRKRRGTGFFDERDERLKPGSLIRAVSSNPGASWGFVEIPSPLPQTALRLEDIVEQDARARWWDEERVRALVAQMSERSRRRLEAAVAAPVKQYAAAFKRVRDGSVRVEPRFDGIAGCLRPPRGGSSRQILMMMGRGRLKARHMTAREYGRLQGAGDGFRVPPRQSDGMFAFGDAVCAPAIRWIAQAIINPLVDDGR